MKASELGRICVFFLVSLMFAVCWISPTLGSPKHQMNIIHNKELNVKKNLRGGSSGRIGLNVKVKDSSLPGMTISIQQRSLNYMAQQFMPLIQQKLSNGFNIPDIHTEDHTPIGKVELSATDIQISGVSLTTPTLTVGNGVLMISLPDAHADMHCNWKYDKKHFVSDHGSADAHITIAISLGLEITVLSPTQFGVTVNNVQAHFSEFDLKLHGGASWLYNFFIKNFKHNIEDSVIKIVTTELTKSLNDVIAKSLSTISLEFDLQHGIVFDSSLRQVTYLSSSHFSIGVSGLFYNKGGNVYNGQPTTMLETLGSDKMIEIFIDQYVLNTAGFASSQANILNTVVTSANIPKNFAWLFNTSSYSSLVPSLYSLCNNCEIQLDITDAAAPTFNIDTQIGLELDAQASAIFQVIKPDKSVINAFALKIEMAFDTLPTLQNNNLTFAFTYKNASISLQYSNIGQFSVGFLSEAIKGVIEYGVIPIANMFIGSKGVPIPVMKGLTLSSPAIVIESGYICVRSDFTFQPQQQQKPFKNFHLY